MGPICLTMIVKNEEAILPRCVASARPFIDAFAIVDTGSTDGTISCAEQVLDGLPGALQMHPWNGFGDAKTVALALAREVTDGQGYALVLDADEVLEGRLPDELEHDAHGVWVYDRARRMRYKNVRLLSLRKPWRFEGVRHERPVGQAPYTEAMIETLAITSPRDGARARDPERYRADADAILAALYALPPEPDDRHDPHLLLRSRYRFYLAQSYRDAGQLESAIAWYRLRAVMGVGGNFEEVYISHLEEARALDRLGRHVEADRAYLDAHHAFPERVEALEALATRVQDRLRVVHANPQGTLFVERGKQPCTERCGIGICDDCLGVYPRLSDS